MVILEGSKLGAWWCSMGLRFGGKVLGRGGEDDYPQERGPEADRCCGGTRRGRRLANEEARSRDNWQDLRRHAQSQEGPG